MNNFEEAIVYHELADSITNAMEELNSRELIASLQKKYENEKLRNDNLQMKVRYTTLFCGVRLLFYLLLHVCVIIIIKIGITKRK